MLATERIAFDATEIISAGWLLDPSFPLDPAAHMADLFIYLFRLTPHFVVGPWWRRGRDTADWSYDVVSPAEWRR